MRMLQMWKCCRRPEPISNWRLETLALATLATLATFAETVKTASQPWVTNQIARVEANVATNLAAKAAATNVVAALGQTTTNTVVYSATPLLIRPQTDADGVKRYRLIDLSP